MVANSPALAARRPAPREVAAAAAVEVEVEVEATVEVEAAAGADNNWVASAASADGMIVVLSAAPLAFSASRAARRVGGWPVGGWCGCGSCESVTDQ